MESPHIASNHDHEVERPIGAWTFSFDTQEVTWDAANERIWGVDPNAEITVDLIDELTHPDDRAWAKSELQRCIHLDVPYAVYFRIVRPTDAQTREVLHWGRPRELETGEHVMSGGTIDVTPDEVDSATSAVAGIGALPPDGHRARELFDRLPVGLAMFSLDLRYREVNRAFADLFDASPADLIGLTVYDILEEDEHEDIEKIEQQLLTTGVYEGTSMRRTRSPLGAKSSRMISTQMMLQRSSDGSPAYIIAACQDVTAEHAAEESLRRVAITDPLTNVLNRAGFLAAIREVLEGGSDHRHGIGLLFCDLDGFKSVNDRFGHAVGDAVLIEVTRRLQHALGDAAIVGRIAGDEICVLLPSVDRETARQSAQTATQVMREPLGTGLGFVSLTMSVGLATRHPGTDDLDRGAEALLDEADKAMYFAKRAPGTWVEFDDRLRTAVSERIEIQRGLHAALRSDELVVHYQPLIDLPTRRCLGVEALVRWNHPVRGLLEAYKFMPEAAASGLAGPISNMVLEEACRQAVRWQDDTTFAPDLFITVNISAVHASQSDFAERVAATLRETGCDPRLIRFELTEESIAADPIAMRRMLDSTAALGVALGIDDFGTGYAALSYLRDLPVSFLKLDGSFIRDIVDDTDAPLVRHVVALAHDLGLTITAEQVETAIQLEALERYGVDHGQGYLWAPALSPDDLDVFLRSLDDANRAKSARSCPAAATTS